MANPTWPISLPTPLVDGSAYVPQGNAIRSQMDGGVKTRRRYTAVRSDFTFSLVLTQAQMQTLDDFAAVTLADVLPFDWIDFRKPLGAENVATYVFKSRPKYVPRRNGIQWQASIELELLTTFQGTFLLDVAPLTT